MQESDIKIGLIGLGYWGKNILRNLCELGCLHTACDLNPEIIEERKKVFPAIKYATDVEEILQDADIKAVAIATPAVTHYELAKRALQADKDVFVEKPLALNSGDGRDLVELAQEKEKVLMVGHILQYHPAVIKLKDLIKKGELGKIQYIYSNRLNIGKLRVEENILWSFAPHDISVILMLAGDELVGVHSFGKDYLNEGIQDVTLTTLQFRNETRAHIFVSWLHPFKEQKLVVVGSKAMAVFDDMTEERLFIYPHTIEWQDGRIPIAHKAERYPARVDMAEPLKEEMKHFLECVQNRKAPKTDGNEGLRVLAVLEEAEKSIQGQASPVKGDYFVHESACVDKDVDIGEGTKIWHYSHILKNTRIGRNCVIGQNVSVGPDVKIGNRCKIQNNVSVYKGVTIEDEVFCGPSCVFTNVYNPRAFIERKNEFLPTLVKKGATIGANATIVCGVTIGKYAFIGAGAVAKKDVADHALVVGVPAKQIGWICRCGIQLKGLDGSNAAKCESCGCKYELHDGKLVLLEEKV